MSKRVKTYKSCSDIPIYNFMLILKSSRFDLMISNADQLSDDEVGLYIVKKFEWLKSTFKKIEEEYKSLIFEKRELDRNKEIVAMKSLETKHNLIIKVVSIYLDSREVEVLEILNDLDVGFDKDKDIIPQLQKAKNAAKGLRNKINIKQAAFKAKYRIDEDAEYENTESDIEKFLDSQALSMESNLETGYRIDIKKTSVLRWVNLMERNRYKTEQLNKIKNK